MMNATIRRSAALLACCLVVGTTPANASRLTWEETPTGIPAGIMYAVDTAAGATWAVGTTFDGPDTEWRPVALRHDGAGWKPTAQPTQRGRFLDVAVRTPADVWAAGERSIPAVGGSKPGLLVQRWDGRSWRVVQAPPLPGVDQAGFTSVATTGGADGRAWLAGWSYSDQSGDRTLIYRHDRNGWHSIADKVSSAFGYVNDILPLAGNDIWTANFYSIGHYDGRRWKKVDLPGDDTKIVVMDLEASGPNDIWAAGLREDPVLWRRPLVLHYDGVRWTEVPTPAEPAQLNSIELADGEPVAVGESGPAPYVVRRGDGGRFERTEVPPRGGVLMGLAADEGRLWVAGVADATDRDEPYIAVAKTR